MATCPLAIQLKLEDQIPFVDAEGSCDGSISSIGTGSILGHSTTSEEYLEKNESQERLWKFHPNHQDSMGDHHSLNNILDTVSSSQTRLTDLDYSSVDKLDGSLMDNCQESVKIHLDETAPVNGESGLLLDDDSSCLTAVKNTSISSQLVRPTSLSLESSRAPKGGYVSLTSAYASLIEQVNIM